MDHEKQDHAHDNELDGLEVRQICGEDRYEDRTDDRTGQRPYPPNDDDVDCRDGPGERENGVGLDRPKVGSMDTAGETSDERANGKRVEFHPEGVHTHILRSILIITDGAQSDAKFRMQDQCECPGRSRSEYQSDVIERVRIMEMVEGEINSLSSTSHYPVDHPDEHGIDNYE